MKATLLFISIIALSLLLVPMIALNFEPAKSVIPVHSPTLAGVGQDTYAPEESEPEYDEVFEAEMAGIALGEDIVAATVRPLKAFKILNESTGEVEEVSLRDFVRGAVAAEMPASFHPEALKAQAVAAYTFALHNRMIQSKSPDPELKGADFKADPKKMKVYITEKTAKEFYGDDSDIYWEKICKAADSVMDYALLYDGEPIVAAYHAISSGKTEDASNIWSGSAPYLLSVPSEGDLLAPGFESTVMFSEDEVKKMLEAAYPDIELGAGEWFGAPIRSDSGYVSEIWVGGLKIPGKELRQVFGLRSHDFEVAFEDGHYIFTVTGYGHGVGLSQYGADFMARQGASFDEILKTYYTGAELQKQAG